MRKLIASCASNRNGLFCLSSHLLEEENIFNLIHGMYEKLKQHYMAVKDHTDLTAKSIPFFENKLRDIQYELLMISNRQGEQQSKEVTNAIRFMELTDREDLFNIKSYPRDTAKLLGRAKDKVLTHLAFVARF